MQKDSWWFVNNFVLEADFWKKGIFKIRWEMQVETEGGSQVKGVDSA